MRVSTFHQGPKSVNSLLLELGWLLLLVANLEVLFHACDKLQQLKKYGSYNNSTAALIIRHVFAREGEKVIEMYQ